MRNGTRRGGEDAHLRLRKIGREGDLHRVALIGQKRQRLALEHPESVTLAGRLVDVKSGDGDREMASIPRRKRPLHLVDTKIKVDQLSHF